VLVCEDDGVGVPLPEKECRFEQCVGKNTGMGLFLSREILMITSITIRESGDPCKGARFEIMIPPGSWRMKG
jgi:sensor histidine kinase regulating citrate/malate metabolism